MPNRAAHADAAHASTWLTRWGKAVHTDRLYKCRFWRERTKVVPRSFAKKAPTPIFSNDPVSFCDGGVDASDGRSGVAEGGGGGAR